MSNKQNNPTVNVPEKKDLELVSRESIIGDVISKHPYAIEVFMDYGIHCVGCSAASFETMEQGIVGHGFSEGELLDIIREINDLIQNPPEDFEELVY